LPLLLYAPCCIARATNSAIILRPLTLLYALLYALVTPLVTELVTAVVTLLTSGSASYSTQHAARLIHQHQAGRLHGDYAMCRDLRIGSEGHRE
jgi:hypothetical protein